ncbi:MAG: FtsX-like permease family protein, partial [Pseudomonadota bacterium]
IGSILSEKASIGVGELDNTYSTMGPLIKAGMEQDVEHVARSIHRQYMVSIGDKHFHESIKFVDKPFLNIFDFDYISGDTTALDDPNGIVITEEIANKWFGRVDNVVGESIRFNHEHDFFVSSVVKDVPINTHFHALITGAGIEIISSLVALNRIADWDLEGNWNNISTGHHTYVMTPQPADIPTLQQKVNAIFDSNVDPEMQENFMRSLTVRQLKDTSSAIWDMVGMPVIESVQLLGLLVLVIAIVNYTNLATAQSMGRAREVGLRKTMGAKRSQLMAQFLLESLTTAVFAMLIAMAILEAAVPAFNEVSNKVVQLDYIALMPWLLTTTVAVGLIAGAYPSVLITKTAPITALKDGHNKGVKGNLFRSTMIGVQFMLSIFMLAVVMIVFFQNEKVRQTSNIYPKDEVLVIERAGIQSIKDRHDVLKSELLKVNGISHVSMTMQVPFEQSNAQRTVSKLKGDEENKQSFNLNSIDYDYLDTFDIPLVAGRNFDRNLGADQLQEEERRQANVIVNELFISNLGFGSPLQAIGQSVWGSVGEETDAFEYTIVGVIEDQNFQGLHNAIKPWLFMIDADDHSNVAIRIEQGAPANTVSEIEEVWQRVIPDYPIEHGFLDDVFNEIYVVYKAMNGVLAGFAALALLLALIGLFGMAAFMARGKTREIGIRKVLGASLMQIIRLISWQFSKPVIWAIVVALPLAYMASSMYLQFFAERIDVQVPLILFAGIVAVVLAWVIIAFHALRVARANPIHALRYE